MRSLWPQPSNATSSRVATQRGAHARVVDCPCAFAVAIAAALFLHFAPRANAACDGASHLRWADGISRYAFIPGGAEQGTRDLAAIGSFLLVPDVYWGLSSYEITAPGVVELRDHIEAVPRRIEAQGDLVYLVEETGVRVIEVGPAGQLVPRGSFGGVDPADLVDLAVAGDFAYLAGWTGLRVLSVADPDAPSLVATLPGDCTRVVANGDRAYVSRISGLWTVDVSVPSSPTFVGSGIPLATLSGLAIDGSFLYGAATASGLHVFDLADPDAPALAETVPFTGAEGLALGDGYVIVGSSSACRVLGAIGPQMPASSRSSTSRDDGSARSRRARSAASPRITCL